MFILSKSYNHPFFVPCVWDPPAQQLKSGPYILSQQHIPLGANTALVTDSVSCLALIVLSALFTACPPKNLNPNELLASFQLIEHRFKSFHYSTKELNNWLQRRPHPLTCSSSYMYHCLVALHCKSLLLRPRRTKD